MRTRQAVMALLATSALALTACGSDDDSEESGSAETDGAVVTDDMGIEVNGEQGEAPTLTIPDEEPPGQLQVQVLSEGDGAEVGGDDVVVANYLGQTWEPRPPQGGGQQLPGGGEGNAEGTAGGAPAETEPPADETEQPAGEAEPYIFDSSFERGEPAGFSLDAVIPGWKEGLTGQKVGSRVLLSIPPEQGYGTQQGHDLQNDTLVFVVDVVETMDGAGSASGEPVQDVPEGMPVVEESDDGAPTVDMANATAPEASDSTTVIAGDGEELGDSIVINMVETSYPDGAKSHSTWDEGQTPLVLAPQQLAGVPGLAEALEGQSVGTRVITRIAAADNPGQDGSEGTPLAMVIDVIGTF